MKGRRAAGDIIVEPHGWINEKRKAVSEFSEGNLALLLISPKRRSFENPNTGKDLFASLAKDGGAATCCIEANGSGAVKAATRAEGRLESTPQTA